MEDLSGQVAIVTGAAKGLGRAFAAGLRASGLEIVGCDVDADVRGIEGLGLVADVSRPEDVRRVVDSAVERHGRIDLLVNNAGVVRPTRAGDPWEQGLADFQALLGTNLYGAFLFGRAVAPIMIEQGAGHIVNISTDHIHPMPPHKVWGHGGMDLYNASKWALNGLTLDWATTLRERGIRVNGLCMGATDTPMLRGFAGAAAEEVAASAMRPEQVCDVLLALLAEGPEGRSGHNVGIWVGREPSLDDSVEVGDRLID